MSGDFAETFRRFTDELTRIVAAKGANGLGDIADALRPLLRDPDFEPFAFPGESQHKRVLFHDAATGVYVLAHAQEGGKRGRPHSHGASWAVYGNIAGTTEMTEWRRVNPAGEDGAVLEIASRYRLAPGDARAYGPGIIHSTEHPERALVIRITGTDLDTIARYHFNAKKDRMMENAAQ